MFGGTDFTVPSVVVYQYRTGFEDLVLMGNTPFCIIY